MSGKRESWQLPRRTNWQKIATAAGVVVILGLVAALVWLLMRPGPQAPAAAPPPPTAHSLTAVENAGMQAILARYRGAAAYTMTGDIRVGRNTFGVQWDTLADASAGTGTLKAGGTQGKILLDAGTVSVKGDQQFWSALGVTGVPPAAPGWVNVGPEFMDGKLFYPAARWTAALAPTAQAILDGDAYTVGTAAATVTGDGIAAVKLPDTLDVKVASANAPRITDTARPLIAERGGTPPVLQRSPSGGWALPGWGGGDAPPPEEDKETGKATPTPTPTP